MFGLMFGSDESAAVSSAARSCVESWSLVIPGNGGIWGGFEMGLSEGEVGLDGVGDGIGLGSTCSNGIVATVVSVETG